MSKQSLIPDGKAAVAFLQAVHPGGPYHLAFQAPDGRMTFKTFYAGQEDDMAAMIDRLGRTQNVYHHVNRLKEHIRNAKAKEKDVDAVEYIYLDIDDRAALARIQAINPAPTAVVNSGNGFHMYWKLEKPTREFDRVRRIIKALIDILNGDAACIDPSRLLRVAITVNHPNTKKREAGRVEAEVTILTDLTDWSRTYSLDAFPENLGSDEKHQVRLSTIPDRVDSSLLESLDPPLRNLIEHGHLGEQGKRYNSRSEALWRVILELLRAKVDSETIGSIIRDPSLGISASVLDKPNPRRYAERQIEKALLRLSTEWPDMGKSGPRPTLRNAIVAILRLGIHGEFDEFHRRKILGGHTLQDYQGALSDDGCAILRKLIIDEFEFDPGKDNVIEAANIICLENSFHPIRDYLRSLKWDGVERLDTWLIDYLGAEDTALNRAIARIVLVAAVRRIRRPGTKFDVVLVLEGPQGSGKSTAIRILAGDENFTDQELLTQDPKAQMEALEGIWIVELSELEGLGRADTAKVKAFISRTVDRGRPAYGRFRENRPREAIFIGSKNDNQYLRDTTGNRRFWPVRTATIDLEALRRDRDQLWAEAARLEEQGISLLLPKELWGASKAEQDARLEEDPWVAALENANGTVVGRMERISTVDLLETNLSIPKDRQQQWHLKRASYIMKGLGWDGPKPLKFDGRVARGYERPHRGVVARYKGR